MEDVVRRLDFRSIGAEFLKEVEKQMPDYRVKAGEISEDQITALLESQTAKWPTSFFLGAAFASMIASLVLKAQNKDNMALFIGQWAAPF